VYVPDFFNGEVLPFEPINRGNWHELNLLGFMKKISPDIREPDIFECARALRAKHKKVALWGSVTLAGLSSAWVRGSTSHRLWIASRPATRVS
jgi:hypothetical protein